MVHLADFLSEEDRQFVYQHVLLKDPCPLPQLTFRAERLPFHQDALVRSTVQSTLFLRVNREEDQKRVQALLKDLTETVCWETLEKVLEYPESVLQLCSSPSFPDPILDKILQHYSTASRLHRLKLGILFFLEKVCQGQ
jgi:hypothetical protein